MKRLALALLLLTAVAGAMLLAGPGGASPSFNPDAAIDLSSHDTATNADITSEFSIPGGDVNLDTQITFTPGHPHDPTKGFFIAPGVDIPDGTVVGELSYVVTLGLLNGPCSIPLPPMCTLLDASLDTSDTIAFDDQFEDTNGNGIPDGAERYPDFLNTLFPGITPWARMYCEDDVGGIDVSVNVVAFAPGDLAGFSKDWGYPSVTILNDPTEPLWPGAVTDLCTPVQTASTVYGLADGLPYRANPCAPGSYTFRTYARGLPDADGDGFENAFDTCPYDINKGDARLSHTSGGGDGATECLGDFESVGDGIDCACDPDPNRPGMGPPIDLTHCWENSPGSTTLDCDGDGFDNRGDNCPLIPNPGQEDTDTDSIGDICDDNPGTVDGSWPEVLHEIDVEITGPDVCPVIPVGGIVEIEANTSGFAIDSAADSSGGSAAPNYVVLAGAAAGAIAVAAGALYARRRWLR